MTKHPHLSSPSDFGGVLLGLECSKEYSLPIDVEVCNPSVSVLRDSSVSTAVVLIPSNPIVSVLGSVGWPEIDASVIEGVSVDVVNANTSVCKCKYEPMQLSALGLRASYIITRTDRPLNSCNKRNVGCVNDRLCSSYVNLNISAIAHYSNSGGLIPFTPNPYSHA